MKKRTMIMVFGVAGHVGMASAMCLHERGYHIVAVGACGDVPDTHWTSVGEDEWMGSMSGCAAVINCNVYARPFVMWDDVARTQQILNQARQVGVRRVVYLSHRAVLGAVDGDPLDAQSFYVPGRSGLVVDLLYHMEMLHVRALALEEMDCVVVVPGMILRPDGGVLQGWLMGAPKMVFEGTVSLLSPVTVAQAMMAALERGQKGRRYVCAGDSVDVSQLLELKVPQLGVFSQLKRRVIAGSFDHMNRDDVLGVLDDEWVGGQLGVQKLLWKDVFARFLEVVKMG